MNRIALSGTVWLASDIHLGPATPGTRTAFHTFLDRACAQADALILCGDIFDAWIGDDVALHDPPAWLASSLHALQGVAQAIPVWIGRGNRDFLIGETLTDSLGAKLLRAPVIVTSDFGDVLVSHGDEYCTDDISYQRFKRLVNNPLIQKIYLSLSMQRRRRIASYARQRSMSAHARKASAIMDVTPATVKNSFESARVNTLIHGHTHRPGIHRAQTNRGESTRVVLPDWDCDRGNVRGGWAVLDRQGVRLQMLDELADDWAAALETASSA